MKSILRGARIVVETCMGVKKDEDVLIVTDPLRLKIGETIADVARQLGARTTLICMPVGKRHGAEPPDIVGYAMRNSDVVIAPTTYSITHTQARRRAIEAGARVATMPMITEGMMKHGALLADYSDVKKLTISVSDMLKGASSMEVTTRAGTNLRFSIKGRKAHSDTGIYHNSGDWGNLPAGEAYIAPVEGTAEGLVVVDGTMLDTSAGRVEISFEKGLAKKITGRLAGKLSKILREAGPNGLNLAEFGIGTNPKAHLIGNVLEDEKVLRTCHIALGDNSTFGGRVYAGIHLDGIFLRPTVKFDGKILMKDGKLKV